jgi:hypothetical protein
MASNPMNIGPTWQGNYEQPDYRVPTVDPNVQNHPVGANPMGLEWPLPEYTQPGTAPASGQE